MTSQLVINGLIAASGYVLVGLGVGLVYSTARFIHFAHAIVFTLCAYLTLLYSKMALLPIWLGIPLSVLSVTMLGVLIEVAVYRPLRRRRSSSLVLLLASLGVYTVIQNIISLGFGDQTRSLRDGSLSSSVAVIGARASLVQLCLISAAIIVTTFIALCWSSTRIGRTFRAIASDPDLASALGVSVDRYLAFAVALASALAGIAGILIAFDLDMQPTMGLGIFLMAFIAFIVGGGSSFHGLVLGAVGIAGVQQISGWFFGAMWEDAIAFMILGAFLAQAPGRAIRLVRSH